MKRIPSLPISILSVLLLAIPACEDKDEKDRPQELVGTWFMHDSDVKMKLTSNINQNGIDPYAKGASSLSVTGNSVDVLLNYLMVSYLETDTEDTVLVLSNNQMGSYNNLTYPFVSLMLSVDEFGQKFGYLDVAISENEYDVYLNSSDYHYEKDSYSLSMSSDTLFTVDFITGEVDSSNYVVLDGTYQAKPMSLTANIETLIDFQMFGEDGMVDENQSVKLESDGLATFSGYDSYEEISYNDLGEWYVEGNLIYFIMEQSDDYSQSNGIDTMAFNYQLNGTDLTLIEEQDVCEEFYSEDIDDSFCYKHYEMTFGLQSNSISELKLLLEYNLNQTPHSPNRNSLKKFDLNELIDRFRRFNMK